MKSEHLPLLNSVSAPAVHPDGGHAVVSVIRPDFDADAYVGQLWTVPLGPGQAPRRLTRGFRDTAPDFSPDGQMLAFLRAADGGKPQLHIVEAGGGEPLPVTGAPLGVSQFAWSPDSRQIVYGARTPENGRYGSTPGVSAGSEDARLITDYKYRMNGVGYTADQPVQLFLVEVPDLGAEPKVVPTGRALKSGTAVADGGTPGVGLPAARQLTTAATDHTGAGFSADGLAIYFVAALHRGSDADLASGIYRLDTGDGTGGAEPLAVVPENTGRQDVHAVRASPDGHRLFFLAQELGASGLDFVARNTALYVLPAGGGDATRLSDAETMDLSCNGRIELSGPDAVLLLNTVCGTVEVIEFHASGKHQVLVSGKRVATGAAASGGSLVVSFTDAATAGDTAVLAGGQLRILTDFSAALRSGPGIIKPLEFTVPSADGYPVHGWLVQPPGRGPHPVLLNIHGGPFAQFTGALFDEAQVYAAAGYAVLMCNPRGSAGYGQDHGRAIKEKMGTLDMQDVLAFLDGALSTFEELDAGALGIMGGSYGGYLTAWTISHDHRFKAAIVERGFLDPVSFVGSSDIGWFFGGEYTGRAAEQMAAQSPMSRVDRVRTASLVIHSEEDLRCPVEQGQRYFTALKQHGVEAAFLVFPGENHELSRTGTPHHRKQRFDQILRWWARYLPTAANPAPADVKADGTADGPGGRQG
ncbi:S9 family peptidase [Arthrobacter sp. AL08]|uniref:S9 family peptidase n=1 Tax=Micrococcaceae TaxID=1268 RepID=UPI001CFF5573|nr:MULTISPECIES: S9 family peptidase [Micrococcaceae]MCB5283261.1 Dipeptidyl-peptidase 5 [Arthrobacter sp. ES1]MDI3241757.1 S9 family peptidase [Arthrobacter sp. AL05]MDI3277919.1 S9 family peptidase [Arthrobacter sp. AL08]MDJ0351707.1 S9 family peptidase [Pseudarthrobacter sp. PH31-O2]WGZ81156.1 S9 family peptidase [Arthrobacter sp. EM1]